MILLTGTYNSLNAGDATMQRVAASQLEAAGHEVVIASPFPEIDASFHHPTKVIMSNRRRAAYLVLYSVVLPLHLATGRRFGRWLLCTDELRQTEQADFVVDLSGDMLTEDAGLAVGFSHMVPLLISYSVKTPYSLCAQSIGPFVRLKWLARFLLRRASFITVREDASIELLSQIGVSDVRRTADLAFLMTPAAPEAVPGLPARTDRMRLGVSISPILVNRYATSGADLVADLGAVLREVSEREGAEVLVVPHVTGPTATQDDRIPARLLATAIGENAILLEEDLEPEQRKGAIGTCDAFVGARMHANMAALSQAVAVSALGYSHKALGIMDLFGQRNAVLDGGSVDRATLAAEIDRLIESRSRRSDEIRRHLPEVIDLAGQNVQMILDATEKSVA